MVIPKVVIQTTMAIQKLKATWNHTQLPFETFIGSEFGRPLILFAKN